MRDPVPGIFGGVSSPAICHVTSTSLSTFLFVCLSSVIDTKNGMERELQRFV